MSERHAYGTSFGCVSRRIFILLFCLVMSFVCVARIGSWVLHWAFHEKMVGRDSLPEQACYGMECYEVFTCRGFAWTTQHVREPLATLFGVIAFPIGFNGALHGYRDYLKVFATFATILAAVYLGCLVGDIIYYESCNAYPANVIYEALLWPIAFPIRAAAQDMLKTMAWFPAQEVNTLTGNFAIWTFYIIWMCLQCAFFTYAAWEARMLGMLVERGPLGLGVHYGLGQWDEIINHEAFKKRREPKSKFVEDGKLPLTQFSDPEEPFGGYLVGHNYGAFHQAEGQTGPSKDIEHWQERMRTVDEAVEEARGEFDNKKAELREAKEEITRERGDVLKMEEEAERDFREKEVDEEKEEERRAEELAQDEYERKRREAERDGKSRQEANMVGTLAYQKTLRDYHKDMIRLAKARTLHEHFRHSERQKTFVNKEESMHKVQESMAQVNEAGMRLKIAEQLKRTLEQEKAALVRSGQWRESENDVALSRTSAYPRPSEPWIGSLNRSIPTAPIMPSTAAFGSTMTWTPQNQSIVSPPTGAAGTAYYTIPLGTAGFGSGSRIPLS